MNKQRFSLLLLVALATAAAAAFLRRRQEAPDGPSFQPMPEPPEPPRIVLPQSVLQEQEQQDQEGQQQATAETPPVEEPLRERAVGEPLAGASTQESTKPAQDSDRHTNAAADNSGAQQEDDAILGYCMHCRERRPIADGEEVTTESGRRAMSGTCPECGTRIFRFLPSKD